jgi:hypothetical protein
VTNGRRRKAETAKMRPRDDLKIDVTVVDDKAATLNFVRMLLYNSAYGREHLQGPVAEESRQKLADFKVAGKQANPEV